jgi:hypothetical protein
MPKARIGSVLNSTRVALETEALSQFGAVVEDFQRGGSIRPAPGGVARDNNVDLSNTWIASSYAAALAGTTDYRPKLKFLFKVEFIFKPEIRDAWPSLFGPSGSIGNNNFTFLIKTVDRPKVDFEYEDDVNEYNFRTKVLKKIRHRELTLSFMDDVGNRVFDFFRALMLIHQPITRRSLERDDSTTAPTSNSITTGNGMRFGGLNFIGRDDVAHRGVINTNFGGAIEVIRVKQMFVDPVEGRGKYVIFDFLNPRIISFDLDELSHESSDPNLLTMQFDYDWMEMVKVDNPQSAPTPNYQFVAPGARTAPYDVSIGARGNASAGASNPFAGIIASQGGRLIREVTSDSINKAVRQIAGNGRFASAIGSAISTPLSGIASGLTSGALSTALNGAISTVTSNFGRFNRPPVKDSTVPGRAAARQQSSAAIPRGEEGE